MRTLLLTSLLTLTALAGCIDSGVDDAPTDGEGPTFADATYQVHALPAEYQDPLGLYEPTIDVGGDGALYVSAHSTGVGDGPAPAYFSLDDGATWESMALFMDQQAEPEEQGAAPILSDEVFIVAGEDGTAWGLDCCSKLVYTQNTATGPVNDQVIDPVTDADPTGHLDLGLAIAGYLTPDAELPLVGWCANGAEVCHYNQNSMDHTRFVADAQEDCIPYYGTDRPWLAYANGKLLLVNNPGSSVNSFAAGVTGAITGESVNIGSRTGPVFLQVGALDVPPPTPFAYNAAPWGIEWNLCGSSGGFIPGIPDMRDDHFFAVPQWVDFADSTCNPESTSHYDVITGHADDLTDLAQTTVFHNTHVAPAEDDSTPSQVGWYGQTVFDADGALYVGAMNNSAILDDDGNCVADPDDGGLHFALSTDDGETYVETTFRFDRPVSSMYMDGNRYGEGFLLNWGEIDGNHTDWFLAHVFPNDDGTLRLQNVMLAVDDGPESSRHVQGAALGPDGRGYMTFSYHAQNPGASDRAEPGDTPLRVAVQQDGPTMPVA